MATISFERLTDGEVAGATLVEGLPGHGMVASIAVEQLTEQLDLDRFGSLTSDEYFPVVSYESGRVRDPIRLYAGGSSPMMTLQSNVAIPLEAFAPLAHRLSDELGAHLDRAVFLVERPAPDPDRIGTVSGIASTDELAAELTDAGIPLADDEGLIVGPTGALADRFSRDGTPIAILLVDASADPFTPDPGAARTLIEGALEPFLGFDIDTTELREQEDAIRRELQDLANQFQSVTNGESVSESAYSSMYQ